MSEQPINSFGQAIEVTADAVVIRAGQVQEENTAGTTTQED